MNKLQKQSLNDYLAEPEDVNLTLFVHSINPLFNLKGEAKKNLVALIGKYQKDQTTLRLKAIEQFLGAGKVETVKVQQKAKTSIYKLAPDRTFEDWQNATPEEKAEAVKQSELNLIFSILGDWRIEGTHAWEILNGSKPSLVISSNTVKGAKNIEAFNIRDLIRKVEKYSGKKSRVVSLDDNYRNREEQKAVEYVQTQGDVRGSGYWLIRFNGQAMPDTFTDMDGTVRNKSILDSMKSMDYI